MVNKLQKPKRTIRFKVKALTLISLMAFNSINVALTQTKEFNADFINQNKFELSEADKAIETNAQAIRENAKDYLGDDLSWLEKAMKPSAKSAQEAQLLIDSLSPTNTIKPPLLPNSLIPEQQEQKYENPLLTGQYEQMVFITYALGDQVINEILEHASHNPNVLLVMRGVPEGQNFYQGILHIQQLASVFTPVPNIVIDPELFKQFNVTVAPTVVHVNVPDTTIQDEALNSLQNIQSIEDLETEHLDDFKNITNNTLTAQEQLKEVARVEGLTDTIFLTEQIKAGETGDLGQRGPVVEIAEPDLIEVMKQQAAQIDWEDQKEGAIKRVWHNQEMYYLANAPRERVRLVDPSIVMQQDIMTPNGEYIVKRGDVINPFDIRPMDFALVIFNPLEKKQIPIAKAHGEKLKKLTGINQVMYLATEIDRDEGWDFYNDLSDTLDEHVYLLTADIKERFRIEYVPSLVQSKEKQFMITELHVPSESEPEIIDMSE